MTLRETIRQRLIDTCYADWMPERIAAYREDLAKIARGEDRTEEDRAISRWGNCLWLRLEDRGSRLYPNFYLENVNPKSLTDLGLDGVQFTDGENTFEIIGTDVMHDGMPVLALADLIAEINSISSPPADVTFDPKA